MKKIRMTLLIAVTTLGLFTACEETMDISPQTFDGVYEGEITMDNNFKSGSSFSATAEITDLGNGQLEVYCYGGTMDTTFILNHFQNHDSVMVCLDSMAFEHMYGHAMGHGNDTTMNNGSGHGGMNGTGGGNGHGGMSGTSGGSGNGGMNGAGGGSGHGGMMCSDSTMTGGQGGSTLWTDHMNNEHNPGDVHFGGFDLTNQTFSYTMKRAAGDYHFYGKKVQ